MKPVKDAMKEDRRIEIKKDRMCDETNPIPEIKNEPELLIDDNGDFDGFSEESFDQNDFKIKSDSYDESDEHEFLTDSECASESKDDNEDYKDEHDFEYDASSQTQQNISEYKLKHKLKFYEKLLTRLCQFCAKESFTKLEWQTHLNTEHNFKEQLSNAFEQTGAATFRCKTCNAVVRQIARTVFQTYYRKELHFFNHQLHSNFLKCKLCENTKFDTMKSIGKHIDEMHSTDIEQISHPFKCPKNCCIYCGQIFRTMLQLPEHFSDYHKELDDQKIIFVCPSCGEEFAEEQMWSEHCAVVHHFDEPTNLSMKLVERFSISLRNKFKCLKCSEIVKFKKSLFLVYHASTHMQYKIFKCRHCFEQFDKKINIRLHICAKLEDALMLKLPPINYAEMVNLQSKRQLQNLLFICPICGEEFDSRVGWNAHLIAEHELDKLENLKIMEIPNKIGYKCCVCDQTWRMVRRNVQMYHAFTHMPFKTQKCKICKYESGGSRMILSCYCQQNMKPKYKLRIGPISNCTLQCTKCGAPFENGNELNNHLCAVHNIRLPEDLNFKLVENGALKHNYECTKCQDKSKFQAKYYLTMFLHAILHDKLKLCKCNQCDKTFSSLCNFRKHIEKCQNTEARLFRKYIKYLCPACGHQNASIRTLRNHIKNNHDFEDLKNLNVVSVPCLTKRLSKYKCTVCDYVFEAKKLTIVQNHAFFHMQFKLYNCEICSEGFDTPREIVNHLKAAHNFLNNGKIKHSSDEGIIFYCPVCNKKLKSQTAFTQHINEKHQFNTLEGLSLQKAIVNKKTLSGERYECLDCGASVYGPINRLEHKIKHLSHKPYQCKLCKLRFIRKRAFYNHITICKNIIRAKTSYITTKEATRNTLKQKDEETDLLKIAPYTTSESISIDNEVPLIDQFREFITYACPECNVSLETKHDWDTHISDNHDFFAEDQLNLKPTDLPGRLKCTDCNLLIETGGIRKKDHKLSHMPFKSFICAICCHRSKTSHVLVQHIRGRHFTPGEFQCSMCSLVLATSYDNMMHCKSAHTPDEYPPHFCSVCMVSYSTSYALKIHMQLHAYLKQTFEVKCFNCNTIFNEPSEYSSKQTLMSHLIQCHPAKEFVVINENQGETKKMGRPRKYKEFVVEKKSKRGRPKKYLTESLNSTGSGSYSEDQELVVEKQRKRGRPRKMLTGNFNCTGSDPEDQELVVEKQRNRGRPRKNSSKISNSAGSGIDSEDEELVVEKRRKRGRPRKMLIENSNCTGSNPEDEELVVEKRRKRGRPRKMLIENSNCTGSNPEDKELVVEKPRKRGRPRKILTGNFNCTGSDPKVQELVLEKQKNRGRPRKISSKISNSAGSGSDSENEELVVEKTEEKR